MIMVMLTLQLGGGLEIVEAAEVVVTRPIGTIVMPEREAEAVEGIVVAEEMATKEVAE
jgi:hypothetical protein